MLSESSDGRWQVGQDAGVRRRDPVQVGALPFGGCWLVLLARPSREAQAVAWLRWRGLEARHPVRTVWERRRNMRMPVSRPIFPGYVFARFTGHPVWRTLLDAEPGRLYLRGVVTWGGRPAEMRRRDLDAFLSLADAGAGPSSPLVPGTEARITRGVLWGEVVEVSALRGDMARVLVPMLGRSEVLCPVADLDPIRGA